MIIRHEFELAHTGDEVDIKDLKGATWEITKTFVDVDNDLVVFTHRIEPHSMDELTVQGLE
jgi:hypothetical protein